MFLRVKILGRLSQLDMNTLGAALVSLLYILGTMERGQVTNGELAYTITPSVNKLPYRVSFGIIKLRECRKFYSDD